MKKIFSCVAAAALCTALAAPAMAHGERRIPMHFVDANGIGAPAGDVVVTETSYGLVFTPALAGLPPGLHGFHLHQQPSCAPNEKDGNKVAAGAAGGHYDPDGSKAHGFPWGPGHRGDLPALFVAADGRAVQPALAPRLHWADLDGRSLMIHVGGDNHSDHPASLGGGGVRLLCGVLPAS